MDIEVINNPIVETFDTPNIDNGPPQIMNIQYDLCLLKITVHFQNIYNPIYITFSGVIGFRVLDEGNLLEFWNPKTRKKGWIWMVQKGGWFDLESLREGFLAGITGGYDEYLILGENECVSVITNEKPTISASKH